MCLRRLGTTQALALRARIVLLSAAGHSNAEVARRVHVALAAVGKWRQRFVLLRLDGLLDEPRSGHAAPLERRRGGTGAGAHPGNPTAGRHPLVHALAGPGHVPLHGAIGFVAPQEMLASRQPQISPHATANSTPHA